MITPRFIKERLEERKASGALRSLTILDGVDFSSNDYLGLARDLVIAQKAEQLLKEQGGLMNGSSGSRLIAGHSRLNQLAEDTVARFHQGESALIYNSGYDANVGFFPCIAGRGDTILYDYLSHASIRDGIRLSHAKAFSFGHNDLVDLESKLNKAEGSCFVVVESIYSMDGDEAPLHEIAALCQKYGAYLVVDEAHSTGISANGKGLVVAQGLNDKVFARLHTFGKAIGGHGAAWVVSTSVREFLINFSRSFIYTTALSPHSLATIIAAYDASALWAEKIGKLESNISLFKELVKNGPELIGSGSPIQGWLLKSNERAIKAAAYLQERGLAVKPIRYPTVPKDTERIRIVLHAFNSEEEIRTLTSAMHQFCKEEQ